MSMSREEAYLKAKAGLERAQKKYDKAYAAWQDELDAIILRPMHIRSMSRKEAIQLARAISDDTIFTKIMNMGLLPEQLKKREDNQGNENY